MEFKELNIKPYHVQDIKLKNRYVEFGKLISELKLREIPSDIIDSVNRDIEDINSFSGSTKDSLKQLKKAKSGILNLIEKELKLVPKNTYQTRWMVIGMSGFGIPLGVAFGVSIGNMAFLGAWIPIGLAIGIAIGAGMDKKAFQEGRQLDMEIK